MSKSMMIKIAVAIGIIAVVIPPFIFGGWLMAVLAAFVVLSGEYEICRMFDEKPHWCLTILFFLFMMGMVVFPENWFPAGMALYATLMFVLVLFYEPFDVKHASFTYLLSMILLMACRCILKIYSGNLKFYGMIFVALACYVCDSGAYFFGVFTGKHKMIPRVSPNKTWEGAIGGYFTGALISGLFGYYFLDAPVGLIIAGALVLPAIAEIGDLSFSAVKRYFGIKDFGNLLPGHGGVLDRVDSLLFCLMAMQALMILWGM